MKIFAILIVCLITAGCSSVAMVRYNVTSAPQGAAVDVNGMSMGVTPTTISLECSKRWVGILNSSDGWASSGTSKYEVKAFPPKGFSGHSQTKNVDPCQWKGNRDPEIQFDLGLEAVAPTQKINITTTTKNDSSDLQKSIDALKTLRKSGVISEDEYKNKLLELIQ